MSTSSLFKTECDVFSALCWKIGTPVAWKALCALNRSDWKELVSIKVRPADYVCAKTFHGDNQVACFFKKFPGFDLGLDLEKQAVDSFYENEALCYHSNERLSPLLFDLDHYGSALGSFVRTWRKKIATVLRACPTGDQLVGRFGPGSTFQNLGDEITLAHKLSDHYTATRHLVPFLPYWDESAWSRYAACGLDTVGDNFVAEFKGTSYYDDGNFATRDISYVRGNRFTTVPKDATKHRGICIEPSLNVFWQLAVGQTLSDRMRRSRLRWDKRSCQDFHKVLARLGSLTGAVATIDLSSASDTVCYNLVKLLLPKAWFVLVDALRSPFTLIEGKWVKLEKFSSMGNGYTFELETLLFFTLCEAVASHDRVEEDPYTPGLTTSVFGDDIIVPSSIARSVVTSLRFFGFSTNEAKTFLTGRFRESCGGDFFSGFDVRAHFQKKVCDAPHQLIALANGIRRFGRRSDDLSCPFSARDAWFRCLDSIPRQIRICRGPESLGDLVIHDDENHWIHRNPMRVRNSIRYLKVWRPVPNRLVGWDHFRPGVVLAVALYGASSGSPSISCSQNPEDTLRRSGVVPRIRGSYVSGYRFGRVAFS